MYSVTKLYQDTRVFKTRECIISSLPKENFDVLKENMLGEFNRVTRDA